MVVEQLGLAVRSILGDAWSNLGNCIVQGASPQKLHTALPLDQARRLSRQNLDELLHRCDRNWSCDLPPKVKEGKHNNLYALICYSGIDRSFGDCTNFRFFAHRNSMFPILDWEQGTPLSLTHNAHRLNSVGCRLCYANQPGSHAEQEKESTINLSYILENNAVYSVFVATHTRRSQVSLCTQVTVFRCRLR